MCECECWCGVASTLVLTLQQPDQQRRILHAHSRWALDVAATKIRRRYLYRDTMEQTNLAIQLQMAVLQRREDDRRATQIQKLVRGALGRIRAAKAAQTLYRKYLTLDKKSMYYYNERTGIKQYVGRCGGLP